MSRLCWRSGSAVERDVRTLLLRMRRRRRRAARSCKRSWPALLALLLTAALSLSSWETASSSPPSTDETTTTTSSTTTTSTTLPPPTTSAVAATFDAFTPCETADGLSVGEWASCSVAYNTDKQRQTVTLGLFLVVLILFAWFLSYSLRR